MIVGVDYWAGFTGAFLESRDLPFLKDAGIKMARLEFAVQYASTYPDLVSLLTANGIEILGLLMRKDLVGDIDAWGNWVYNTVLTYKDKVKVWEIWNEPNWNTGFGSPGDPAKYTEFLKRAYASARQADPQCIVVGGSILGTDDQGLNFLRSIYDCGAKAYMDAVAIHPYCTTVSPLYPHETSTGKAFWKLEWARNIMAEYGDGAKKIWVTELGWATQGTNSVMEDQQALYHAQALDLARSWGWVETYIIFNWMDGGTLYFGLMRSKYNPPYTYDNFCKPAFFTVKAFASQTKKYVFSHWQDGDTNPVKTIVV